MPIYDRDTIYLIEKLHAPRKVKELLRDALLAQRVAGSVKAKVASCMADGYVRTCTTSEKMMATMSSAELKLALTDVGLRPKGGKAEMAAQLLSKCTEQFERRYIDQDFVVATESGKAHAKQIRDQADEAELLLIPRIYSLLLKDQYSEARRLVDEHYRVHPLNTRHINANFNQGHLEVIRVAKPAFAKDFTEKDVQVLRSAAVIKSLWNFYDLSNLLRDGTVFGDIAPDSAISFMIRHAKINEMARANSLYGGRVTVQFNGRDSDSCHLCRACEHKTFTLRSLPDFPLAGCRSSVGCGLITVPAEDSHATEDSDTSEDREDGQGEGGIVCSPKEGVFSIAVENAQEDDPDPQSGPSVLSVFMKRGVITCNDLIEALYEHGRISEAERDRLRE